MKNYDYEISHPISIDPSLDIDVSDPSSYDAARSARLQRFGQGSWSPGNPYVEQMQYARNRQDMAALKQQAIEWEANQQQYQQQLADQERMSDPHYQLQRQRAAGINPDIAGGSGSGGSGASVSPPAMADTELTELSSPYKTADRVFSGMQSTSSLISSVSGAMLQGFEFVKNVATFGDMLSMSDSSKRAAKASADVAEGTVDAQIDSIEQLVAGGKLDLFAKIAESLPNVEGGHTVESITKHLEDLGIDTAHAPGVYTYTQSPVQQKFRSDQKVAAAKARAHETVASYRHWLQIERWNASYRQSKALSDMQMAIFEQCVASWAYNSDTAHDEADLINQRRDNALQKEKFTADQLKENIAAFKSALKMRLDIMKRLDDMIVDFSKSSTPMATAYLNGAVLFKSQLESLTVEEFYRLNTLGSQINQLDFVSQNLSVPQLGYITLPGAQARNQGLLNAYEFAFKDIGVDTEGTIKYFDKVFDAILGGASKAPQGPSNVGSSKRVK